MPIQISWQGATLGANTFTGAQAAPTLALGGAALVGNALAVTGTGAFSSYISTGGGVGNTGQAPAYQGMQYTGSTTILVAGGSGAIARLSDNSGHTYIEGTTGVVTLGGALGAVSPQQMTLNVQNVLAGTANTAGANWTFAGSQSTGNAAGGSLIFQTAPAGGAGSTQNALTTALTITSTGALQAAASLAIGGATIGTNALAVTGTANISSNLTVGSGSSSGVLISSGDNSFRTLQIMGTVFGSNGGAAIRGDETFAIRGAGAFGWENGANNPATGTIDTNLSRISAGIVGVGTGAAGSTAGGLKAATLALTGALTVPGVTTAALTSTGTFTSGAAAQVGTLTNAPAAGNPTTWIKIIDGGVTRYIPAW